MQKCRGKAGCLRHLIWEYSISQTTHQVMYALCKNNALKPLPKIPLAWLIRHELGGKTGGNVLAGYSLRRKLTRP